jgi:UDP-N-acetylmuramate--alanine ligase
MTFRKLEHDFSPNFYPNIYILGIGGSGMSGMAKILKEQGFNVFGSDLKQSEILNSLSGIGLEILSTEDLESLSKMNIVLTTSASAGNNPILTKANELEIPILTRHDIWAFWSDQRDIIAVSGCHGKTSTTNILSKMYEEFDFGKLIGVQNLTSAKWGNPNLPFVIEADEFAKTFLSLRPKVAIILNIERDHVEIYPTEEDYNNAFREFAENTLKNGGYIVACGDDKNTYQIIQEYKSKYNDKVYFYGFGKQNDIIIKDYTLENKEQKFSLLTKNINQNIGLDKLSAQNYSIKLIGKHNVLNSTGAIIASEIIDTIFNHEITRELDEKLNSKFKDKSKFEVLKNIANAMKRQEFMGRFTLPNGLNFDWYDDYGHAPTEIKTTIQAFKDLFPEKTIVTYAQIHSFNRALAFYKQFVEAFKISNFVILTDVYTVRGENIPENNETFEVEMLNEIGVKNSHHLKLENINNLQNIIPENAILLSLNAGSLRDSLKEYLNNL